ncbi:MAG: response regulator, partial [Spirochaetaceae bacterium]|nr:response regulator [Spirochaetaceae bacterium]
GFLSSNASFVRDLREVVFALASDAQRDSRTLGGMIDSLIADTKKLAMFPVASLLEFLPKIVRDLSRDAGKQIDLKIEGGEIEIDRRIIEQLKPPLVHLIRNCVDHGIEMPAARVVKGKPTTGTISVLVEPYDGKVRLVVADDGAGIDLAALRMMVTRSGIATAAEANALGERQILQYVFRSGISTSSGVSDLTGRGLGLAIVKEKVEGIGGTVVVETYPDAGTKFILLLPPTIATFRGVLIRAGGLEFVVPTMNVAKAMLLRSGALGSVEGQRTIQVENRPVPLEDLAQVLELPGGRAWDPAAGPSRALVLGSGAEMIAFRVDEVLGEQEVLQKSLGRQLARVRNFVGATVLGTGKLVLILNTRDLLKSASRARSRSPASSDAKADPGTDERKRSVLIAEDSITTRTLLKSILESSGYEVVTAVDGAEALARLQARAFDAVVSDLSMPRLDGFELTARIRADPQLKRLPVILVTALDSREDREHGIDAGANAYIVKGNFDQSDLLSALARLA